MRGKICKSNTWYRNSWDVYMKSIKTCSALFFLLIGGLIYIGYRSETLLMFKWFECIGISDYIIHFRDICSKYNIPYFIKYSLPDGLWLLSYMMIIGTIWDNRNYTYYLFIYIIPFAAISMELIQIIFSSLGTFDILDILSYVMAIIIYQLTQRLI